MADLPWGGRRVRLLLGVRKFRCPHPGCSYQVFTERVPDLVVPYARKTVRLHEVLELVGFALGGEAGARLIGRLGMEASPTTLLRYIRGAAIVDSPEPEVIGVDDFGLSRGRKAATIIVDLENHRPVDILPDCSASTLASWLEAHPSAQTISRDGAKEYARGIADGAPDAVQVVDRWHLLKNLREVLQNVLERDPKLLRLRQQSTEEAHNKAEDEHAGEEHDAPAAAAVAGEPDKDGSLDEFLGSYSWRTQKIRRRRQELRAQRLEQYQRAVELKERGMTNRNIAKEVGKGERTLNRWFAAGSFPERQTRSDKGPRLPEQIAEHLIRRWNDGCHNVKRLYKEIEELGYQGPTRDIYYFVRYLKAGLAPPGYVSSPVKDGPAKSKEQRLSPRSGAWALMLSEEKLNPKQRHWIEQIREDKDHGAALIHHLAQHFVEMIQQKKATELDKWLVEVQNSGVEELRSFAEGVVSQNLAAVRAALTEVWSNGQTEGQINRLKTHQRQYTCK